MLDDQYRVFRRKAWIAAGVATIVIVSLLTLWFGARILLMVFIGLLLALFLSIPTHWLDRHTFLSRRWALLVVLVVLLGLLVAFMLNFALSLSQEFAQLAEVIPGSLAEFKRWLGSWPFGSQLVEQIERVEQAPSSDGVLGSLSSRVSTVFSTTLGALLNVIVVVFVGLFIAFEPETYKAGLLKLVVPSRREYVAELLLEIERKLAWWLVGRLVSMSVVGMLTGVGLWLLGIPVALSLGLLSGLLSFIPYLGPILAALPALLVAFSQDPSAVLHVALLYAGVQSLESYLITPFVQREAVSIPPGLLLVVQVWLGLLTGLIGLLVAEPLIVLGMLLVQRLYVEGWLEKEKAYNVAERDTSTNNDGVSG